MNRTDVYTVIDSERSFQEDLAKGKKINAAKSIGEFLTLIRAYSHKADEAWALKFNDAMAMEEVRKVAALCVAAMEQHGATRRDSMQVQWIPTPTPPQTIPWIAVNSSNIQAIRYLMASKEMQVRFKDSGIYRFHNVPGSIYTGMLSAPSKGKYFHNNIRGKFLSEKI